MHLLPCPECGATSPVSPAQSGDQITCVGCGEHVAVPRLGDLKKLPQAEDAGSTQPATAEEGSFASRVGFPVLALIGFGFLMVAGYSAIRWATIEVPTTTEKHAAELRETYRGLSAADLVVEWNDLEKYGIAATAPFAYRTTELRKQSIGRSAAVTGAWGVAAILGALLCLFLGRHKSPPNGDAR